MESEITSGAMQRLLGVKKVTLHDLAKRGIVMRGKHKGSYAVEASVRSYCDHLREMTAGRGGEVGASVLPRRAKFIPPALIRACPSRDPSLDVHS